MTVAEYVQDELPLFEEPLLPGDRVKLTEFIPGTELDDMGIAASGYVGQVGEVVALEPGTDYPIVVQFGGDNGPEFCYKFEELERL
jgi:hypothetical protein